MKKHIVLLISTVILIIMLCTGCSGPLDESEVSGTYDDFECYDDNSVDALRDDLDQIAETYDIPPEGDYEYVRDDKKLVSLNYGKEYLLNHPNMSRTQIIEPFVLNYGQKMPYSNKEAML